MKKLLITLFLGIPVFTFSQNIDNITRHVLNSMSTLDSNIKSEIYIVEVKISDSSSSEKNTIFLSGKPGPVQDIIKSAISDNYKLFFTGKKSYQTLLFSFYFFNMFDIEKGDGYLLHTNPKNIHKIYKIQTDSTALILPPMHFTFIDRNKESD